MARMLLGLLVTGMFATTGYYAYATLGHPEKAPTVSSCCAGHKCCHENSGERCCSESGECTGKCQAMAEGKCCKDKAAGTCCEGKAEGKCCKDKEAEATAKSEDKK
jgi:hypothetical protein